MNTRQRAHECLRERRKYTRGSLDWDYLTRAAKRYLQMCRDSRNAKEWTPQ